MFKYFNCFFSSFFRTLGRIIVYILLGLVFSTILSKIDVHADVKLNDVTLNYKDYVYIPQGNIFFEFNDDTLYYADQVPQNFIATFCSSDDKITNWYSNIDDSQFPHELNIYKTDIPCQYSTSDYQGGRITYFYGKSFTCPASGNNPTCSSWGKWTFYSYSGSYQLLNFITTNDDISIDFSSGKVISQNQQIINQNQEIINGQNNIINNQNQNKNDIINNQNSNTDKVIDNQNNNTDKQIDSQKVCFDIGQHNGLILHKKLDENGNEVDAGTSSITSYYLINGGSIENIKPRIPTTTYSCFYDKDKNLISCFKNDLQGIITIPTNSYYVRFTIQTNSIYPTFRICQNGNQAISGGLNDINSSINDSSSPDLDALKNTAGWLPAGPIDSILNLPLTLLNSLTTNLSKSCTPVELPLPYIDKTLTLPCLSTIYSQIDGLSIWINSIGVIASAFILFQYLMNLYKWVDDTLSFRENNFIDNWTGV